MTWIVNISSRRTSCLGRSQRFCGSQGHPEFIGSQRCNSSENKFTAPGTFHDRVHHGLGHGRWGFPHQSHHQRGPCHCGIWLDPRSSRCTPQPPFFCSLSPSLLSNLPASTPRASCTPPGRLGQDSYPSLHNYVFNASVPLPPLNGSCVWGICNCRYVWWRVFSKLCMLSM